MADLKELVNQVFESLQLGEGDTIEKFSAKGKSTGKLKQGTIRKKLGIKKDENCLLYTSPSPRDRQKSRMPSSA